MPQIRDWNGMKEMSGHLLRERSGHDVQEWNRRVRREAFADEKALRAWLAKQGVTGYAQSLLVMERFGYPDYLTATADQLIDGQYADRPSLRPVLDAVINAAMALGEVVIQARKTYVSMVTARRTFARVQATTRTRVDLGLRLRGHKPGGRLEPCRIHESMQVQIGLASLQDVDEEVLAWLQKAYEQSS